MKSDPVKGRTEEVSMKKIGARRFIRGSLILLSCLFVGTLIYLLPAEAVLPGLSVLVLAIIIMRIPW